MKKAVWVIVLNWNGSGDTVECVESCLKIDYEPYQILIVDNHSTDHSAEVFRRHFPDLPLIVTPKNGGYAGGNNIGIQYALSQGADYIFLLNNDVVVEPAVLTKLAEGMDAFPEAALAAPKVLYYDDREIINSMGTSMDWLKLRPHLGECGRRDRGPSSRIIKKKILVGCALMIRCAALEKLGLLDENFFMIHEDADWCLRSLACGYENIVVPEARVYHKGSKTTRHFSELTHYYSVRNFLYLAQKNARGVARLETRCGFFLLCLKNLLKLIFASREERRKARVFFDATSDYLRGAMGKCARENWN